jgi:hypothetical protein
MASHPGAFSLQHLNMEVTHSEHGTGGASDAASVTGNDVPTWPQSTREAL